MSTVSPWPVQCRHVLLHETHQWRQEQPHHGHRNKTSDVTEPSLVTVSITRLRGWWGAGMGWRVCVWGGGGGGAKSYCNTAQKRVMVVY